MVSLDHKLCRRDESLIQASTGRIGDFGNGFTDHPSGLLERMGVSCLMIASGFWHLITCLCDEVERDEESQLIYRWCL